MGLIHLLAEPPFYSLHFRNKHPGPFKINLPPASFNFRLHFTSNYCCGNEPIFFLKNFKRKNDPAHKVKQTSMWSCRISRILFFFYFSCIAETTYNSIKSRSEWTLSESPTHWNDKKHNKNEITWTQRGESMNLWFPFDLALSLCITWSFVNRNKSSTFLLMRFFYFILFSRVTPPETKCL